MAKKEEVQEVEEVAPQSGSIAGWIIGGAIVVIGIIVVVVLVAN